MHVEAFKGKFSQLFLDVNVLLEQYKYDFIAYDVKINHRNFLILIKNKYEYTWIYGRYYVKQTGTSCERPWSCQLSCTLAGN
jgi:hypothetical protein